MGTPEHPELSHVGLGLLEKIGTDLEDLVAYLRDDQLTFELDTLYPLSWGAGGFADQELGRLFRGVAVFNLDAVNDIQVGFAAGQGTAGKKLFTISPRGYLTLPLLVAHVSVGGVGAGVAVVVGLRHAPPIAGGRF